MRRAVAKEAAAVPQSPTALAAQTAQALGSLDVKNTTQPAAPAVAPQAKPDPMQVERRPLSPEQERDARKALLSRLRGQLADMSRCELQSLAWYADIQENDRGGDTPAEHFIGNLVMIHYLHGLTPDNADRCLEEF